MDATRQRRINSLNSESAFHTKMAALWGGLSLITGSLTSLSSGGMKVFDEAVAVGEAFLMLGYLLRGHAYKTEELREESLLRA
jgi:hypothetical protein